MSTLYLFFSKSMEPLIYKALRTFGKNPSKFLQKNFQKFAILSYLYRREPKHKDAKQKAATLYKCRLPKDQTASNLCYAYSIKGAQAQRKETISMRYLIKRTMTWRKGTEQEYRTINWIGTENEVVAISSEIKPVTRKPLTEDVIRRRGYKTRAWAEKNHTLLYNNDYGVLEIVEFDVE